MMVGIATPLHAYTGANRVEAEGATLGALLADLDRRFPGLRFRLVDEQDRVRPHMRIFVNGKAEFELSTPLRGDDQVAIVQALSGG